MDADIVFDTSSGFSESEQREILENIEAATRKDAIAPASEEPRLTAKKRGGNFPLLVNLGGALLLIGGVLVLSFFYRQDESELRGGGAALGMTDRKLIQEIRRANEARIHEKEREIAGILAKLSGVDGDLQSLQSSIEIKLEERETELRRQMNRELDEELDRLINQELSEAAIAEQMRVFDERQIARINAELSAYRKELEAERQAAELNLQKAQEEYRHSLAVLQSERAGILEAARMSEASLRTQLEERTGEITRQYEQNRADLNAAREELGRLTDEQERAVLVDRQMSGFYTMVRDHIRQGVPERAAETLALMREFLETPGFEAIRAVQSQKEGHLAAINTLSAAVEGLQARGPVSPAAGPSGAQAEEIAALREENAALTQTASDQAKEIAVYRSQGTDLARSLREFEESISTLRTQSAAQAQTISAQERDLTALRAQTAAQEREIGALRSESTAQAQTISAQERDLAALRTQNTAQTRTITEQAQQITTLRSTNTSLFQAMENLQQALDSARQLQESQ
jgi:chromosome segregation ATPase